MGSVCAHGADAGVHSGAIVRDERRNVEAEVCAQPGAFTFELCRLDEKFHAFVRFSRIYISPCGVALGKRTVAGAYIHITSVVETELAAPGKAKVNQQRAVASACFWKLRRRPARRCDADKGKGEARPEDVKINGATAVFGDKPKRGVMVIVRQ